MNKFMTILTLAALISNVGLGQRLNTYYYDNQNNSMYGSSADLNGSSETAAVTEQQTSDGGSLSMHGNSRLVNAGDGTFESEGTLGNNLITNGNFDTDISNWSAINSICKYYSFDYNGIGSVNMMLDSATSTNAVGSWQSCVLSNGTLYKLTYTYYIPAGNVSVNGIRARFIDGAGQSLTIRNIIGVKTTVSEYFIASGSNLRLVFYLLYNGDYTGITVGDKIYLDDISLSRVLPAWTGAGNHSVSISSTDKRTGNTSLKLISTGVGDSTTNYIALPANKINPLVAGNYYTFEYWAYARKAGTRLTLVIGDKSKVSDTLSYNAGFEKVVFNFQATAATVNQDIKIYSNQADSIYIDDVQAARFYPTSISGWFKTSTAGTNLILVSKHTGTSFSNMGLRLYLYSVNGKLTLENFTGNGVSTSYVQTSNTYTDGSWHYYTANILYDKLRLFVDSTQTESSYETGVVNNSLPFTIGRNAYNAAYFFSGYIGELQYLRGYEKSFQEHLEDRTNGIKMYPNETLRVKWQGENDSEFLKDWSQYQHQVTGTNLNLLDRVGADYKTKRR